MMPETLAQRLTLRALEVRAPLPNVSWGKGEEAKPTRRAVESKHQSGVREPWVPIPALLRTLVPWALSFFLSVKRG